MARQGKIARLPHALREEVNLRLMDGQTSGVILSWLNAEGQAMKVWEAHFEGMAASPQNLSEWRSGGYREWIARREKADNLKTLSSFAVDLAKSGGHIADGAAAILSGHILEALEQSANLAVTGGSDDANADPAAGLAKMASAVASMQSAAIARERLDLDKRKAGQKDQSLALDREKFEKQTVKMLMDYARKPEVQAVLTSRESKSVQMDKLHAMLFGHGPKGGANAAA
jgi:hypothetical protein